MDLNGPTTTAALWGGHLRALGAIVLVALAAHGTGCGLGRWLPRGRSGAERLIEATLLGVALLGPGLYWIGHLGWSARGVGLGLGALALVSGGALWRDRRAVGAAIGEGLRSWWSWLILGGLVAAGAGALAPPLGGIENEAIAATLLAAQRWLVTGASGVVTDHPFTALPWSVETLQAAAYALSGPGAAGGLGVFFLALLAGVAWLVARDFGVPARWAPAAAWLVVTLPALAQAADQVRYELAYGALALGAWRAALGAREVKRLLGAAILAGGAAASALQGWWVAGAVLVMGGVVLGWRRGGRRALTGGLAAGAVIAVLGGAWLGRNVWCNQAPVLPPPPWLWPDFAPVGWSRQLAVDVHHWLRGVWLGPAAQGGGLLDFFALPWRLDRSAADFQTGRLTLAVFALAWLGFAAQRRKAAAWWGLAWAVVLVLGWFFTWRSGRLLAPVMGLAAVAGAAGLAACDRRGWRRGVLVGCLAILAVTVAMDTQAGLRAKREQIAAVFSAERARARLAREIPWREVLIHLNANATVRRVLVLTKWLPGYYLEKDYVKVAGHFGESPVVDAPNYDLAIARAGALGCSHVLDLRDAREGWHVWRPQERVRLVKEWPGARLFAVETEKAPAVLKR